jgi:TRAP-type C4-dicarboxylate transport system permease small subunit
MLVRRLSGRTQFAAVLLAQVIVLVCCAVLLWGLIRQHSLNVANTGMVTGISLSVVYSVAYLCAASIGILTLANIAKLLMGKITPASLIPTTDSD